MKTLFASLLIACSVVISSSSFAQTKLDPIAKSIPAESTQFLVVTLNTGKIDVTVLKSEVKKLTVQVVDSKGKTLVSQSIGKYYSSTRTRFDLSELPDGIYHVELIDGNTKQVKDIQINTHNTETLRTVSLT